MYRNGKDEKLLRLVTEFRELKFYPELMRVIYEVKDQKVADLAIEFYNGLYASMEPNNMQRREYLESTLKDFRLLSEKRRSFVPRTLKLIDFLIDESEKACSSSQIKSLATMLKGETLVLDIVNETVYGYDSAPSAKNFTFKTDSNSNLFDLRSKLAATLSLTWQELKIMQKDELPDILNSRLIKELNIKINEPLKVSKRYYNQPQEELIIGGKLSMKAIKAFESIFTRFSIDGLMNKD